MPKISISPVEVLYLDEIAELIAYARNPQVDDDPDYLPYQRSLVTATEEVNKAATNGVLNVRHPQTHGPFPMELGVKYAVAFIADVITFLAGYGISIVIEPPKQSAAEPAPVVRASEPAPHRATWTLTKPKRFQGYAEPLYLLLESAHREGEPTPTAREVLQAFARQQPDQIAKVIEGDSLDYYLASGETKTANLRAIGEVIRGMTGKSQD